MVQVAAYDSWAVAVLLLGIRFCILVRPSTTTRIASNPLSVRRPVAKPMQTCCQGRSGTARGLSFPKGDCRKGLAWRHMW